MEVYPLGYNFAIRDPPDELLHVLATIRTNIYRRYRRTFEKAKKYYESILFQYSKTTKTLYVPRGLLGLLCVTPELLAIRKLRILVRDLEFYIHYAMRRMYAISEVCRLAKYIDIPSLRLEDYYTYVQRLWGYDTVSVADLKLWDSQKRALASIIEFFRKFGSATLWATTGAGKTRIAIASHIVINHGLKPEEKRKRTIFLTLSKTLAEQAAKKFINMGIPATVFHSEIQDLSGEVVCITVGSVYSAMKKTGVFDRLYGDYANYIISKIRREMLELQEEREVDIVEDIRGKLASNLLAIVRDAKLIIFDECHHVPSMMSQATVLLNEKGLSLGLSATPWREDGKTFEIYATIGAIMPTFIDNKTLIREGHLVPAKIVFFHIRYPREDVIEVKRLRGLAAWRLAVKKVIYNEDRNRIISEIAKMLPKPELILVREIEQGRIIADMTRSHLFYSRLTKRERNKILSAFAEGRIRIMVATTIADEGLDVPTMRSMIQAQGGRSSTRAYQRVGRVVRIVPNKEFGIFIDIWDEFPFFEEHARRREEMYKLEEKESPSDVGWEIYHVHSIDELKRLLSEWGVSEGL